MGTKTVYYSGDRSTNHKLCTLVPGENKLDDGIADELILCGLVVEKKQKKKKQSSVRNREDK